MTPQGSKPQRRTRGRVTGDAPHAKAAHAQAGGSHLPVMLDEVLATLQPRKGGVYLDGTFGGGGYARGILAQAACTLWAIDRDPQAIVRGEQMAQSLDAEYRDAEYRDAEYRDAGERARLRMIEGTFGDMLALLAARGVERLDGVVLDLGVSSFQIDEADRGFSFRHDGPLDMRMSRQGDSAADLVNALGETDLADVIYRFGEERLSRRIARAIVAARQTQRIETTLQLAGIIRAVVPPDRSGRIDPATRSFQALRIHVNDELGEIERGLSAAASLLAPGGRLIVVSFHSLEDRIVKRFMIEAAGKIPAPSRHDPRVLDISRSVRARFRLLENKALRPGISESSINPRARSAKLRGLERLPENDQENARQNADTINTETMPPAGSLA